MSWREEHKKPKFSDNDGATCPQCGKRKKPKYPLCFDCSQKEKTPYQKAGGGDPASPSSRLPDDLVFDTFYDENGKLRKELFFQAPQKVADLFRRKQVTKASVRQLYQGLRSFVRPLQDKQIDFDTARERFSIFYVERIVRQVQRGFMLPVVADVIERHKDLALSDEQEMIGLFRYVTNILCYFGDKEESRSNENDRN
ncbi:MAG: hypothetical protein ACUVX8_03665 [Candidatus Zipacnadales bacterium]